MCGVVAWIDEWGAATRPSPRSATVIARYKHVIGDGLGFRKDGRRSTEVAVAHSAAGYACWREL
jgi:hypothetical protein